MTSVFVSYSHEDLGAARGLKEALAEHGYDAWLADEQTHGAESVQRSTGDAFRDATVVVLLIGRNPSRLARNEWGQALLQSWRDDHRVPVIPVVLPEADPPSFLAEQPFVEVAGTGAGWELVAEAVENPARLDWQPVPAASTQLDGRLSELHKTAEALSDER